MGGIHRGYSRHHRTAYPNGQFEGLVSNRHAVRTPETNLALIVCEECTRTVSDKAPHCPHCGNPIQPASAATHSKPTSTDTQEPPQELAREFASVVVHDFFTLLGMKFCTLMLTDYRIRLMHNGYYGVGMVLAMIDRQTAGKVLWECPLTDLSQAISIGKYGFAPAYLFKTETGKVMKVSMSKGESKKFAAACRQLGAAFPEI
jgi:hypothetical protein